MNRELKNELQQLYLSKSKHSNYQSIPEFMEKDLELSLDLNYEWRGDKSRYAYIEKKIKETYKDDTNIKIADIGANTGYFSLNLAYKKYQVISYELNSIHSEFIKKVADLYELNQIQVLEQGVQLDNINDFEPVNCILLLNVLHHAGADFEKDKINDINELLKYIKVYLERLKGKTEYVYWQLGYNWGGNKEYPIIETNNYIEMIQLMSDVAGAAGYEICDCSIYDKSSNEYVSVRGLMESSDKLNTFLEKIGFDKNSEFYKRPIFVLKTRKAKV